MKEFWDSRYGEAEYTYGTEPSAFFAGFLYGKTPGRLLKICSPGNRSPRGNSMRVTPTC